MRVTNMMVWDINREKRRRRARDRLNLAELKCNARIFSHTRERTNLYGVVTAAAWHHHQLIFNLLCIWLGDECLSGRWTQWGRTKCFRSIRSLHTTGGQQWLVLASRGQHFTGSDRTTQTHKHTHECSWMEGSTERFEPQKRFKTRSAGTCSHSPIFRF